MRNSTSTCGPTTDLWCFCLFWIDPFNVCVCSRCPVCARTFCLLWTSPWRLPETRSWGKTISYAIITETATPTGRLYNCISVRILVLLELWLRPFYCPIQCHLLLRCFWYIRKYLLKLFKVLIWISSRKSEEKCACCHKVYKYLFCIFLHEKNQEKMIKV